MKKVYFISGLGADKRVFSFLDLSFCEPVFIDWIPPHKNELLKDYALRLRLEIKDKNPTIVGLSFGGMLATEMAKADSTIHAIIISSSKLSKELPFLFKLAKIFPLYKIAPPFFLKKGAFIFKSFLGARGEEQKKMIAQIIKDTDIHFLKWAMSAVLSWNNKTKPANLIQLHGTADKLLPYKLISPDYTIKDGTHVMPMDKHEEISALLKKLI